MQWANIIHKSHWPSFLLGDDKRDFIDGLEDAGGMSVYFKIDVVHEHPSITHGYCMHVNSILAKEGWI